MDNDLISRSALIAALENEKIRMAVDKGKMFRLIEAAPAIDAVEVVRCGECEKRKTIKCALSYLVFEDFDVDVRFIDVPDDFYCPYGERRSDVYTEENYVTRNAHLCDVDGVPGPPCCTVGIKFRSGDEQYGTYTTILDPFPNDEVISNAAALLFKEILDTERNINAKE